VVPNDLTQLDGLLDRLEALWRDQGAPIADQLAPGLSHEQLDEYERASGLTFPAEIRRWWGWHDGVRRRLPDMRYESGSLIGVGGWEFLSCAEALAERTLMLEVAPREGDPAADDDEVDVFWRPSWLPVSTANTALVFVDCVDAVPTVRIWHKVPDDVDTARAQSWTGAVAFWVRLLAERYYFWSPEHNRWQDRWDELPPELRVGTVG
jgi:cell wall assembly regulator SMI1